MVQDNRAEHHSEQFTGSQFEAEYLLSLLEGLQKGYGQICELLLSHMEAVSMQKIDEMEQATQFLVDQYDFMEKLEAEFREHLETLFRKAGLSGESKKLSRLAAFFPGHTEELQMARESLHAIIEKTQSLKNQADMLLEKARAHNEETMNLVRSMRHGKSLRYDGLGGKNLSGDTSIIFNQKV